ncbi:MAG: metal ABC transporter ATP-binding protein [Candidatus Hydrogenedens sp.]|nr:metal ABC transporter ATP-binding protein [Candidatus Hydrogenedens sp.]
MSRDVLSENIIILKNVSVYYNSHTALDDINLSFRKGEFTVILGPNGSGKTTLLKVLCGLCKFQKGSVKVLGQTPSSYNFLLRRKIAHVAQVESIDPKLPMTVRESVAIGRGGICGLGKPLTKVDWDLIDSTIKWVGISHLANKPIGQISGGERQKASIARALVQQAPILLLDEPTASIDPNAQKDILDLLEHRMDLHRFTTLYVTHELAMIPNRCDRVVMLQNGKIWADGKPEELLVEDKLKDLYGGNGFCCSGRFGFHHSHH